MNQAFHWSVQGRASRSYAGAARSAGQRRLEVGDREIGAKGVEVVEHPVHERADLPGLIVEARRDGAEQVETAADVLEDDARDRFDSHVGSAGEPPREKLEGVGRRVDQELVAGAEPLDERTDAGRMAASFAAEADGDLRHAASSCQWSRGRQHADASTKLCRFPEPLTSGGAALLAAVGLA
jgi:hypothetical protein